MRETKATKSTELESQKSVEEEMQPETQNVGFPRQDIDFKLV